MSSCQTVQINKWKIAIELSNPVVNNLMHQSTSQSHNQIRVFLFIYVAFLLLFKKIQVAVLC